MYSSVWNRVALLAAGMAVGWNLVNLMVVPESARQSQLVKVVLGGALGVAVVVALAVSNAAAAIMGLVIFCVSGLVAYAGNARHVSNVPPVLPLLQPARPLDRDSRHAVLLVHPGEPEAYDGPLPWARRLARLQGQGKPVPHWFGQPRLYARIRSTLDALPPESSVRVALSDLAKAMEKDLGDSYLVELGLLTCEPSLVRQLSSLAEEGISQISLVPLGLDQQDLDLAREEVTRCRVREVGVQVRILNPQTCPLPDVYGEQFAALSRGDRPISLDVDVASWANTLADAIR